jgi:hypothetical protein
VTEDRLDELISGFLDGELEPQESRELEQLLQRDSEATRRLRVLQNARNTLANKPLYRLPSTFADKVLAAAKQEAERLQLPADHPIRLAKSREKSAEQLVVAAIESAKLPATDSVSVVTEVTTKQYWVRWAIAAAASVMLISGIVWWSTRPGTDNVGSVQNLAQNGSSNVNQPTVETPSATSDPTVIQPTESALANSKPITNSEVTEKPLPPSIEKATPSKENDNSIASKTETTTPASTPNAEMDELKSLAGVDGGLSDSFKMLMIVDITISEEAWSSRAFSQILNEYGIAYERPILADSELKKALEDGSLVAKSGTDESSNTKVAENGPGEVDLVFVQGRAARLDNAINEIYERTEEFPTIFFDLTLDAPCQDVLTRLEMAAKFEGDAEEVYGIATVVQNNGPVSGFVANAPRGNRVADAARLQGKKQSPDEPVSLNPVSTILFVIRKPAGAEGRP